MDQKKSVLTQKTAGEEAKQSFKINWKQEGTLYYGSPDDHKHSKLIAAFDMDDTLITTKSGAKFASGADDWKWWNEKVVDAIRDHSKKGFRIVIFTNQNGISLGKTKADHIQKKIQALSDAFQIQLSALIASADDVYRKPSAEMWKFFASKMNNTETEVDLKQSVFCGDAAGRVKGKVKDFNDTDLKFAINIGITFKTPEQFFLQQDLNEDYSKDLGFNPAAINKTGPLFKGDAVTKTQFEKPANPEMVILTGSVGSGKSTFAMNYLKDYIRVNRDTLKTQPKCLQVAGEAMNNGKYVVIDNTNPKVDDRAPYVQLAKQKNYPVRCFYFGEISKDLCMHNDTQRELNKHRQHLSKRVGKIPIHSYFKNSEQPTVAEGFSEVRLVNFIAGPFENKDDETTYFSFVKGKK